jgi:hypothetical protein
MMRTVKGKQRKQEKQQEKTISIIVDAPADRALPDRLKNVAVRTNLSYCALLHKWLSQEENAIELRNRNEEHRQWERNIEAQLNFLQQQIQRLIYSQGRGGPVKRASSAEPSARGGAALRPKKQDIKELLEKIGELKRQGLSLKRIAERFNDDGLKTITGKGKWLPSSVSYCLRKQARLS